ncbi:hypothetical protein JCM11641_002772 [Rhodosporidiobolus odoratus]
MSGHLTEDDLKELKTLGKRVQETRPGKDHIAETWRKSIRDYFKEAYRTGAWDEDQKQQAIRILHFIKKGAEAAAVAGRPLSYKVHPFDPSPDNVDRILVRASRGQNSDWVEEVFDDVQALLAKQSRGGKGIIVRVLFEQEFRMRNRNDRSLVPPEEMLAIIHERLKEFQQYQTSLTDLSPGLYGNIPRVQDPPHPPHPPRDHQLRAIGHRAAKHYGTTKARWEAGHRW